MRTDRDRGKLIVWLGLLLAFFWIATASAGAQPYHAGVARLAVPGADPFDVMVAYPTRTAEERFDAGPFPLSAARGAPVAAGARFPIILFSHGNGRKGGSPVPHRGLVLHLAREGFVVIAPYHTGARPAFAIRPQQMGRALDTVRADARFGPHIDPARVAAVGFSFGGAVALATAGAPPDLAHLSTYCRDRTDDPRACDGAPADVVASAAVDPYATPILPVKAIVLLEPYGAPFSRKSLAAVTQPVLIFRAQQSDLRADGNALWLAQALPVPPQEATVPGGHFVFIDPCPPKLATDAAAICRDAPGVDRAAIHAQVRQQISDFLGRVL